MTNLINLLLNLAFIFAWVWVSFDLISKNQDSNPIILIIYSFIICLIILIIISFLLGLISGFLTVKYKLPTREFTQELEENRLDEKLNILESPEIVCVFKDKMFSKQIKFNDKLYNFYSVVHTNNIGKYLFTEELPKDAIILIPGGIYVPEKS